jgi:hypothetical protein
VHYHHLLSSTEQAYLSDKEQFSKTKKRYLRYRIRKKLNRSNSSRDAAAASRDGSNSLLPTSVGIPTDMLIHETLAKEDELRGSPRPAARAGSNLVGRGIANPMSERTRGFEMLLSPLSPSWWKGEGKGSTSVPLPALFSFVIFSNFV